MKLNNKEELKIKNKWGSIVLDPSIQYPKNWSYNMIPPPGVNFVELDHTFTADIWNDEDKLDIKKFKEFIKQQK